MAREPQTTVGTWSEPAIFFVILVANFRHIFGVVRGEGNRAYAAS